LLRITNFNVPFDDTAALTELAAKRLKLPPQAVLEVVIVRKAVDARRYKNVPIQFVYVLDVKVTGSEDKILAKLHRDKQVARVERAVPQSVNSGTKMLLERPVVVGFGPAGMFAALTLAQNGYKPLVLERGRDVDRRQADIAKFWAGGQLDPESNVQFGEGGAGTFSDGKLTTRISDINMQQVLEAFIAAGAPPEIKYLHKPHIGTDILRTVVKNIRREIIRLGGEVRFEAKVEDIAIDNGRLKAVTIAGGEKISCYVLLLGIGHSARDTYAMLRQRQVTMEAKPFAVGVRIEHPQELIDRSQYGVDAGDSRLPAADYALTFQDRENGRGAYSFCMCPGGMVVAAASENGGVVTNGMSNYHRNSGIANSALLVTVGPEDFGGDILAGIEFQREWEQKAFRCAGSDYRAPVQSVGDFLAGATGSTDFLTRPTYTPGVKAVDLRQCLPDFVTGTLFRALPHFDRKIKGFADPSALMTGVEMRSSAPCRIRRGRESYVSENTEGLYPIGEGAGYAGGIMSAAVDGMNAALAVIRQYKL